MREEKYGVSINTHGVPGSGKPEQTKQPMNLAARAGRWSAQHRKVAIWGWLAFTLVAFASGAGAGTRILDNAHSGVGESGRADRTVDSTYPKYAEEMVLVQSRTVRANDASFQGVVADAEGRLKAVPHNQHFESPYSAGNHGQISKDGRSALLRFQLAGTENEVKQRVAPALATIHDVQAAHPDFTVGEFGDASVQKQLTN